MAKITLKGNPIHTSGELPAMGAAAPHFRLTDQSLTDRTLADYAGKRVVVNIFPSVDTPVCAMSVRQFNQAAGNLKNTVVLGVSRDLPFAFARFCGTEGLQNVVTLSEMRALGFGEDWGVRIVDGPLAGLLARAVVVLDEQHRVIHRQLVPEIGQEPDYDSALAALK